MTLITEDIYVRCEGCIHDTEKNMDYCSPNGWCIPEYPEDVLIAEMDRIERVRKWKKNSNLTK